MTQTQLPPTLPKSCLSCINYDQDHYCALPREQRLLLGYIISPSGVVCARHQSGKDAA